MGSRRLGWLIAAAISAYACHLAVLHPTPIDRALPFIGAVLALAGASIAVPALIVCEIVIVSEPVRLIAFGVVIACGLVWSAATAVGLSVVRSPFSGEPRSENGEPDCGPRTPKIAIASLLLLRWIPFEQVHLGRELFLLACALVIAWLLRNTPFAMLVAVVVCLITPAYPLRTLAVPLAVIAVLAVIRFFHMPRIALTVPSLFVLAWILTFFAWSGVVARAFPYFTRVARTEPRRHVVNAALARSHSVEVDVPAEATALIVSGANVSRLRRGTLLGRIEPGGIPIRIGDVADWGYMRRDYFYGAHNPLPRESAGRLRDYGYVAWVDGAGLVALPEEVVRGASRVGSGPDDRRPTTDNRRRTIRVVADASLPANATLQVEGFALR